MFFGLIKWTHGLSPSVTSSSGTNSEIWPPPEEASARLYAFRGSICRLSLWLGREVSSISARCSLPVHNAQLRESTRRADCAVSRTSPLLLQNSRSELYPTVASCCFGTHEVICCNLGKKDGYHMTWYLPGYSRSWGWSGENNRAGRIGAHSRPHGMTHQWVTKRDGKIAAVSLEYQGGKKTR